MKNKAIFLDRDGTVIVDKGYLDDPKNIEFIEGIPEILKKLKQSGYLLIIISNQSGVARGYFDEETVRNVNDALREKLLAEYDVLIDGFFYCPHHPDYGAPEYRKDCDCRKPKPGMVLQAMKAFDIDLRKSVMIGDKDSDKIELGVLGFIKIDKDKDWSKRDELQEFLKI